MNHDRNLDIKHSGDPRSDCFDDGYKPRVQPKFVRDINPDHLKPRQPMRNPNPPSRNPSPLKELQNLQKTIFKGEM